MRRRAKENNFKAVLETVRDLMNQEELKVCTNPPDLDDAHLYPLGSYLAQGCLFGLRRPKEVSKHKHRLRTRI